MIRSLTGLLPVFVAITMTACTTLNRETGEREAYRTGTGAIAGAAAGGVLGGVIGENRKSAIIGAGIGAIAGAAVGAYMDRQERALREELSGTGVGVRRVGNDIQLEMPSNITFDTGQAVIKPAFVPVLDDISRVLEQYESTAVTVAGHTDSVGSAEYNQQLSVNRANSVRNYLATHGVISERIATLGFGESTPVADNSTEAGRQQNRRVEITLQPITR